MDTGDANARAHVPTRLSVFRNGQGRHPFFLGRSTVFLAGPGGPAAGDERPVSLDRLGRVDGLVADRGVDRLVPADDLGDVGRQAAHDGIGHEDPSEIMRGEHERVAGGVGQAGRGERADEQLADRAGGECPVLAADGPLEQQRHRRVPDAFPDVVGDGSGTSPPGPEPADGRRQTSASSGLTRSSLSVSVLLGAICSSGTSSPVAGSRYSVMLWW